MAQPGKPYQSDSINVIYDLLFCDDLSAYQSGNTPAEVYPWNILFAEKAEADALSKVLADTELETRVRILACNKLLATGHAIEEKELLGVILEVGLDEGLDVLAAYRDGTARYINYSEKLIVLESRSAASDQFINDLFEKSFSVVTKIGPWDKPRLPFPPNGQIRLTFLVTDGLYFGQGPFDVLAEDEMGGPVIEAATYLMQHLTEKAGN